MYSSVLPTYDAPDKTNNKLYKGETDKKAKSGMSYGEFLSQLKSFEDG